MENRHPYTYLYQKVSLVSRESPQHSCVIWITVL